MASSKTRAPASFKRMLGSNESPAFLGRAMSLMIGQSLLGLVNDLCCFRVRDDFRIPIANAVDDSAQLHPSPRLSVQVVTDHLLNEWSTAPSVLCFQDRKSTRLNSSHGYISYAVFCLKKNNKNKYKIIT